MGDLIKKAEELGFLEERSIISAFLKNKKMTSAVYTLEMDETNTKVGDCVKFDSNENKMPKYNEPPKPPHKKLNVSVKASSDLLCSRISKKTDILVRVEKGFERYNTDPVFRQVVDAISAGADPIEIIVFCLDNLKK